MPAGAGGGLSDTPGSPGHVLGGWGSGLNFNWEGVFGLNLPGYITISNLGIPVGLGGIPILWTLPELLEVVPELATIVTQADIPPEIDRRDEVPANSAILPQPDVETQHGTYQGGDATIGVSTRSGASVVTTIFEGTNMGVLSDIYDIIDTGLGGILPGGVPIGTSVGDVWFGDTTLPVPIPGGGGAPPVVVPPGSVATPGACPPKNVCFKFKDGAWRLVKQRKRRRKRLATDSDIKDLNALKSVLGDGKNLMAWIATHG